MSSDPQITGLLNQAMAGDEDAFTRLFEYYYPRLVRYAQKQIAGSPQQTEQSMGKCRGKSNTAKRLAVLIINQSCLSSDGSRYVQ